VNLLGKAMFGRWIAIGDQEQLQEHRWDDVMQL